MNAAAQARLAAFLAKPVIAEVLAALNGNGEETRVVGGAVRNLLLAEPVDDCDLATTCLPPETIRRGERAGFRAVPTGIAHGTVTLVRDGQGFEVTTLRRDVATDGRHATVSFGRDFAGDALRRDFTVNALSLSGEGRVHDYAGGLADLAQRRIRFIGDAHARIAEDYLRILRFFRFHARYGEGPPDADGFAACIAGRAGLDGLSRERIRAELLKLLVAPRATDAVEAMAGGGLLMPMLGCVPRPARFRAVAGAAGVETVNPAMRLAALAVCVAEDATRLQERLRLSNDEFDRIGRMAQALEALSGRAGQPSLAALRHLAHRLGADAAAGALLLLTASDSEGARAGVQELIAALGATPPFLPTGRDVLALGVSSGPMVGQVLEQARRDWIKAGCPPEASLQQRLVAATIARLAG